MNAAGGPVGGGPVGNQAAPRYSMDDEYQKRLNTYIYDYLLKNERYDVARHFCKAFEIKVVDPTKSSPGRVNGADDMDADSKEDVKKPGDLPNADIPAQNGCFLYDWWCQFWDVYGSRAKQPGRNAATIQEYLSHNMRQQQQRNSLNQQRMPGGGDMNMLRMPQYQNMLNAQQANGMPGSEMAKRVMQNRNMTPQQLNQAKLMQRENSQMDMSGQGRGSPSMANAPSPSKRQRLDDSNFNGQSMGPGGRGQPLSGAQMNNMNAVAGPGAGIMQNGITPEMAAQQQMAMNAAGVPPGAQMGDGSIDFSQRMGVPGGANQTGGNHALQDYQMQLMLLEQQNKKRLLMARQEQENTTHPGQGGAAGTPKMGPGGGPGSPLPDMQNRGSPAPGAGFDPSQIPQGMTPQQQQYYQMQMAMNNRPPSSHPGFQNMQNLSPAQMEQLRRQGMMPNGTGPWPPQQVMQGGPGGQPQQRPGNMPPPPAPAAQEPQRTQPSSPAQPQQAPPTPSQTNKANPKKKNEPASKPTKKNPPKKGANAAATPAADNIEPPTPTPSTPITPHHPKSFGQNGTGPQGAAAANAQQPAQPPQPNAQPPTDPAAAMGGLDMSANQGFMFDDPDANTSFGLELNFDPTSNDVLDNFDFDALLNTGEFNTGEFGELGVEGGLS